MKLGLPEINLKTLIFLSLEVAANIFPSGETANDKTCVLCFTNSNKSESIFELNISLFSGNSKSPFNPDL